ERDRGKKITDQKVYKLAEGEVLEREIKGGIDHSYQIELGSGQFLHVVVGQLSIDLAVSLFSPDNKKILEVDYRTQADEPLYLIAETAGKYRLEIHSINKEAPAGQYRVIIVELRDAKAEDKNRVAVQQSFAEAKQLRSQGAMESMKMAIEKFESSLPLLRSIGDRDGEALTLFSIGDTYNLLRENRKALNNYEQALQLWRAVGNRIGEACTLNSISLIYNSMGDNQRALDNYNQALQLFRAMGDKEGEATTLINLSMVYAPMGESQKVIDCLNHALSIYRALGDKSGEAYTYHNIAITFGLLGEYEKSLNYFNRALPILRSIGDRREEAATLAAFGKLFSLSGDYQKALEGYNQALPIFQAIGDRKGEANTLNNLGTVYTKMDQKEKGLEYYNKVLLLCRADGNRWEEAKALTNIGYISASLKQFNRALYYYGDALKLFQAVVDRKGEAETYYRMAQVERDQSHFNKASILIEKTLNIIESLRLKVNSRELRLSFFASVQDYYDFYIDLLMRMDNGNRSGGYSAKALEIHEQACARSLLESLIEAQANIRQGVDARLLEKEDSLQRQLNSKAQYQLELLNSKHTPEQERIAKEEIEQIKEDLQQVEAEIRKSSPRYAALKYPKSLSSKEIQQQVLDADTVLLEYSLGRERSYLWAVTKNSIKNYQLPPKEKIEDSARLVYSLITTRSERKQFETDDEKRERIAKADAQFPDAVAFLSNMIIAPAASLLKKKRLLVVADGALHYIPFSILPLPLEVSEKRSSQTERRLEPEQSKVSQSYSPLMVEHEVVSLPSASTLAILRRGLSGRKPVDKMIAIFADPVFSRNDERIKANGSINESSKTEIAAVLPDLNRGLEKTAVESGATIVGVGLSRLPFTRLEAKRIGELIDKGKQKIALDFDANLNAIISMEMNQYRVIHFATHGFLNSVHPELSGLLLSMFNQQGEQQIGFLPASEVFNLNLSAELVVLSACSTGLGKQIRGEGLVGLTQGFMYAGTARVMVSLWNINDEATSELMVRFYKKMFSEEKRPAEALREAQIEIWKQQRWQSPYYWAGFVLQGECGSECYAR
ncbi:MAG: CHAT domain-containing tetratricopeptide repeat protein, partial [Acidobacteriota bacterium]